MLKVHIKFNSSQLNIQRRRFVLQHARHEPGALQKIPPNQGGGNAEAAEDGGVHVGPVPLQQQEERVVAGHRDGRPGTRQHGRAGKDGRGSPAEAGR